MGGAALATWVATASLGSFLFGTWLLRGGIPRLQSRERLYGLPPPYFPAPLVFTHLALAVGGLVVWVVYLETGRNVLAWVAFSMLMPVALFGYSMFGRWLGSRRTATGIAGAAAPPEAHLPSPVVFCHGLFGFLTIVLVLAAALGVGGS